MAKSIVLPSSHAASLKKGIKLSKFILGFQIGWAIIMTVMIISGSGALGANLLGLIIASVSGYVIFRSIKNDKSTIALLQGK